MELILISNTKLKIMLNEDDMKQYKIGSEADCAESGTRKAIRSILERAKEQVGFNTDGEEIFVQLYTSKKGGCELFVTKCQVREAEGSLPEEQMLPVSTDASEQRRQRKGLRSAEHPLSFADTVRTQKADEEKKKAPSRHASRRIAFSFPSLVELLAVCRILDRMGIRPESHAYRDDRGQTYLLLSDPEISAFSRLDRLSFIAEYGKRENPDCLTYYISEHGSVICEKRAIETLCSL